jgi:hypothetical protein
MTRNLAEWIEETRATVLSRKMSYDGRVEVRLEIRGRLDRLSMRRLEILVADAILGGLTDLTLYCRRVTGADSDGLGRLVSIANRLAWIPRRGTVTLADVDDDLAIQLYANKIDGLVTIRRSFPSTPHSLEGFTA